MLYSRQNLPQRSIEGSRDAMSRYMHKFINHRSEIKKLKWHEKDFLFQHMMILRNDGGGYVYDITNIPEANDYVLEMLILVYVAGSNRIDFSRKAYDYKGIIPKDRQRRYSSFYWIHINSWVDELKKGKGQYLGILRPMYLAKLKELLDLRQNGTVDYKTFIDRKNIINASFYHIYYRVRYYFDGMSPVKAEVRNICGFNFFASIYTYCHILSRHYIPTMNRDIGGDLNEPIPYLDVFQLPSSILDLIEAYSRINQISERVEYLLFKMDGVKYILWIKYGRYKILDGKLGFEVRSFYRCTNMVDLEKYSGKTESLLHHNLSVVC